MKKLSILFAIFVSSLALAVCSCAKRANDGGGKDNLPEISDLIIYENDVEAVLGDVLAIRATDGKNSVKCSWKSSDESIATDDYRRLRKTFGDVRRERNARRKPSVDRNGRGR